MILRMDCQKNLVYCTVYFAEYERYSPGALTIYIR